ncbi:MAG TPA: hypothetical protein DEB30_01515 [Candidatus Peribacter riflensis]|uniref:Secreted protein n=1 Tax=Candidatus Peribacter riflensis TaxID=1735162 RepID=A0A0S1SJB6_9BACT|nr:MAG: hypothetical protein PeribacterA2_1074 [Candidatus Peribacter riflensis]OGJ77952.1 MAG: hypothetical protein A2398_01520 [Candidatus Peribacteria bacterium RIFOXYB1_FULL_57_12]OGJ80057.1 MAG: hypothetical protein A2412_04190 [Candidatus Peribacteria bacterium RIFOXYC1_FULL_58_8]ALM11533.1 MAG: hypothetical protein PeribacterB2_1076 [Candidatus Peribacter riflensis]ALM12635.1 MAG: hypothetical protein PeribacterC2_1075 [Candidatus Peribacter riflensis]
MAHTPTRLLTGTLSVVTLLSSLLLAIPAQASSANYRYDWDIEWLQQTNGGFVSEYFYDPTLFYYTLPSRAKSFALHSFHRQNYYKTYHTFPPPVDYQREPTPRELTACGNYTFSRYDRVPPFGYECQR